jgi:hypothetical protein
MLCSDTGKTEAIRLEHLTLEVAKDINGTIGAVKKCPHGEGHVLLNILRGGGISVIETTVRKFLAQKKTIH